MDKLPIEVLCQIVSLLPLHDKLACIRVCKKWYDLVTATNLYTSLVFIDDEALQQALAYFKTRQHIGKHVQNLKFTRTSLFIEEFIALITLFPNIRSTHFIETFDDIPTRPMFEEALLKDCGDSLTNWRRHMERIKEWPLFHFMSMCLLNTGLCNNLKNIEISFRDYNWGSCSRNRLQTLLKSIHNAPLLEDLVLAETAINLDDMDSLHVSSPKLKRVKLYIVYLSADDTLSRNSRFDVLPVQNHLESFSISFNPNLITDLEAPGFERTVFNWIEYIVDQHNSTLRHLEIEYLDYAYSDLNKRNIKPILISTLPQLKELKSLSLINFYPLSKDILQAMTTGGIRWNKLKLHIEDASDEDFDIGEGMFNILAQHTTPIASIHTLELCKRHCLKNVTEVNRGLSTLSTRLLQLRHLAINFQISSADQAQPMFQLLTSILEIMPSLESLQFGVLEMHRRRDDQLVIPQEVNRLVATVTRANHLKKLSITAQSYIRDEDVIIKMNTIFHRILQHCANLEEFELNATFYFLCKAPSSVGLLIDFSSHPKLKRIIVKKLHGGLKGYAFSNHPGKYWKNDHTALSRRLEEKEGGVLTRIVNNHGYDFTPTPIALRLLNLAWSQSQRVELDLADCTIV